MIVPDINILIYAINRDSKHHLKAKDWIEKTFSGTEPVGLAWIVLLGFIRITTNERIIPKPLPYMEALNLVGQWISLPVSRIIQPTDLHWKIFSDLIQAMGTAGNTVSDAHLAALCIEHRAVLYSSDLDFSRFPGLRWKNPVG